ncbi:hypothetical protein [uncultured Microbacterium sp.]|uniref:hypothetical protein n=1 Tax=uncultured Microbacterium sp. TaxID=191216 RepID=UPI0035CAF536
MGKPPLIRIAPVEFGFGPLGKALHIGRAIRAAAGQSVQIELCATSSMRLTVEDGLFDGVVDGLEQPTRADAVITAMNVAGVRHAARRGERAFVVDSLAWLWDVPLPVEAVAHRYYYQDLPILPVPERNLRGLPSPRAIPAIVDESEPRGAETRTNSTDLVISLSGLESPHTRLEDGTLVYPSFVLEGLECLLELSLVPPERVRLFGNERVLRALAGERTLRTIRGTTQREFLDAASSGSSAVVSPGLTTILELIAMGASLRMLPPQNFSQMKIHRAFTKAGIVGAAWGSELEPWLADAVIPEPIGAAITSGLVASRRIAEKHISPERLRSLMLDPAPALTPNQVHELIGPTNGASILAQHVLAEL